MQDSLSCDAVLEDTLNLINIIVIYKLQIIGILYSVAFSVSAVSFCIIRAKLTKQERAPRQPALAVAMTPTTFIVATQQPVFVDPQQQRGYPPSYDSAVGAPWPAPLGVGPWTAGVEQQLKNNQEHNHYCNSSKPLPPQTDPGSGQHIYM